MTRLNDLSFTYPRSKEPALIKVEGEIAPGITLLMGENGAGKTTLLHLLAGLRKPSNGSVEVDGAEVWPRTPEVTGRIFFLPDGAEPEFGSLADMVSYHAPFYPAFEIAMLQENLAEFAIDANKKFTDMSLGERKKSMLAYALSLGVELLLLDEPVNGLDIGSREIARAMVARCVGESQSVVMSTHTVFDFHNLFDNVMMLKKGRLMFSMPVWEVASALSFKVTSIPPRESLFTAQDIGRFLSISVHQEEEEETSVDLRLLYLAMQDSTACPLIMQHLNPTAK